MTGLAARQILRTWGAAMLIAGPAWGAEQVSVLVSGSTEMHAKVDAAVRASLSAQRTDVAFVPEGGAVAVAIGPTAVQQALTGTAPVVGVLVIAWPEPRPATLTGVRGTWPVKPQLELLKRVLPRARRVGVLYEPSRNAAVVDEATKLAAQLGLEIVPRAVASPDDLPRALDWLATRCDVLWGIPDDLVYNGITARSILLFSFRSRIPFVGMSDSWVAAGALYAPIHDYAAIGAQTASLVVRILDGAKPGELPYESPPLVFAVNEKTAHTLGVTLPADVLEEARALD